MVVRSGIARAHNLLRGGESGDGQCHDFLGGCVRVEPWKERKAVRWVAGCTTAVVVGHAGKRRFSHNQGRAKLPQRNPSPHSTHRQPPPPTPKVAMFYFTFHSRTPRRSLENVEKSL